MSKLETLKAQHPECPRCGTPMEIGCSGYEIRGCPLPESTCARIADLRATLQQHEATIAEQGTTISVLDGDLQNAKSDLAAAQATIQQRERELEEAREAVMALRGALGPRDQDGYLTCMDCGGLIRDASKPKGSRIYGHRGWCKIAPVLAATEALARHSARAQQAEAKKEDRHVD